VGGRDFLDKGIAFRARVAIAGSYGLAENGENFLGRAVGVFIAIQLYEGRGGGLIRRNWRRKRDAAQRVRNDAGCDSDS